MDYLKDFILVQKKTLKDMKASLFYLPILVFAGIFITLFHNIGITLLNQWPLIASLQVFLLPLLRIIEISVFFTALQLAVRSDKVRNFPTYKFTHLLGQVLELGLIYYLIRNLLFRFIPINPYFLIGILFLIFHALPESIYLSNKRGLEALANALNFLKDNLINFGIPSILTFVLMVFLFNERVLKDDLLDLILYFTEWVLISLLSIYRGHLYLNLYGSNRRKRAFMKHFD